MLIQLYFKNKSGKAILFISIDIFPSIVVVVPDLLKREISCTFTLSVYNFLSIYSSYINFYDYIYIYQIKVNFKSKQNLNLHIHTRTKWEL